MCFNQRFNQIQRVRKHRFLIKDYPSLVSILNGPDRATFLLKEPFFYFQDQVFLNYNDNQSSDSSRLLRVALALFLSLSADQMRITDSLRTTLNSEIFTSTKNLRIFLLTARVGYIPERRMFLLNRAQQRLIAEQINIILSYMLQLLYRAITIEGDDFLLFCFRKDRTRKSKPFLE